MSRIFETILTLQIIDNGTGINPEDYELVAKRHCTSKLEDFSGLDFVTTYGFRGEALSSICNISGQVQVLTKTAKENNANLLTFNRGGDLIE